MQVARVAANAEDRANGRRPSQQLPAVIAGNLQFPIRIVFLRSQVTLTSLVETRTQTSHLPSALPTQRRGDVRRSAERRTVEAETVGLVVHERMEY